ncbi:rRNA maturation RNase YbeY [Sediminicola arcticus]|jgi:probable rRNA maturation factor|uniref:Endoribonuclease YbeY n=1 Tax=Sediminicola arcticus TaxID=1574308 RepID=A0ABV2SQS3_9FLAO
MIDFHFETDFKLEDVSKYSDWAARIITTNKRKHSQIDYIFCDDNYLLDLNQKYLNHNTYTDIITFDYTEQKVIGGDVFISVDRLKENASKFKVDFKDELLRVMSHGILHLMGYKDKSEEDSLLMRQKETECINMFHVEQ